MTTISYIIIPARTRPCIYSNILTKVIIYVPSKLTACVTVAEDKYLTEKKRKTVNRNKFDIDQQSVAISIVTAGALAYCQNMQNEHA